MKEISIGEFARRSRLSLKALRLYDERGVLVPSRVDQASGYRYYDTAQLDQARLVVMLRQLQLPLAAVKELGIVPGEGMCLRLRNRPAPFDRAVVDVRGCYPEAGSTPVVTHGDLSRGVRG